MKPLITYEDFSIYEQLPSALNNKHNSHTIGAEKDGVVHCAAQELRVSCSH
jgi:hypothetical protein